MSEERIAIIDGCLYNEKTGEVCMQARFVQKLVRCVDCKFWDRTNMVKDIGFPDLARCLKGHKDYPDEFWYCADGERISE